MGLPWRSDGGYAEHPLRRRRDVGDLEVGLGHHDEVPGVVDQRPETGRFQRLGLAHREARVARPATRRVAVARPTAGSPDVSDAGREQHDHAGEGTEGRECESGCFLRARLLGVGSFWTHLSALAG